MSKQNQLNSGWSQFEWNKGRLLLTTQNTHLSQSKHKRNLRIEKFIHTLIERRSMNVPCCDYTGWNHREEILPTVGMMTTLDYLKWLLLFAQFVFKITILFNYWLYTTFVHSSCFFSVLHTFSAAARHIFKTLYFLLK